MPATRTHAAPCRRQADRPLERPAIARSCVATISAAPLLAAGLLQVQQRAGGDRMRGSRLRSARRPAPGWPARQTRAIATRCCSPRAESRPQRRDAATPRRSSRAPALRRAPAGMRKWSKVQGSSVVERAELPESWNCWNTRPTCSRRLVFAAREQPARDHRRPAIPSPSSDWPGPRSGSAACLPEPEGPSGTSCAPRSSSRSKPRNGASAGRRTGALARNRTAQASELQTVTARRHDLAISASRAGAAG